MSVQTLLAVAVTSCPLARQLEKQCTTLEISDTQRHLPQKHSSTDTSEISDTRRPFYTFEISDTLFDLKFAVVLSICGRAIFCDATAATATVCVRVLSLWHPCGEREGTQCTDTVAGQKRQLATAAGGQEHL